MAKNRNQRPGPLCVDGPSLGTSTHFWGSRRSAAMFRWWIPAGFLSEEEIEREIKATAEQGFRGLEICVNMADTRYDKQQRAQYGWGTPHWREMYRFILKTAIRYDIQIDTTISPGWPAGVPGITPESDCAAKELNTCSYGPFSGPYTGPVPLEIDTGLVNPDRSGMPEPPSDGAMEEQETPPRNRPVLIAVTAARVVSVRQVPMTGGRFGPPSVKPSGPTTAQYLLEPDSLRTVSYVMNSDGEPIVSFDGGDGEWMLFGFWMRGSGQTNRQGSATEQPCYAVDHLNRRGAQAVIDFWETHILDAEIRELLRRNNGVIFEDSIELDISDYATHWSPDQLSLFHAHRGYDLTAYLPLLTGLTYMDPKDYKYELATPTGEISDLGSRVRNDYCQFLTEVYYEEHIAPIQNWAAELGMGYRSQGYGLPFDLTAIAACSHGPEGESLGFGDGVRGDDRFRTISGGAHMARRPVISDEMGAVAGEGYRWTWRSMLKWINKNMAGGSNLIIFHGMPYAVSDSSVWPGYSPFGFGLAGQWGPRQPEWAYIDGLSDYLSRTQAVLQHGVPRVDAAVLKVYYEGFNFSGLLEDQTLAQAGYTYDFISPNTLQLDTRVKDGRLAPEGPGYRALILDGERTMDVQTMDTLLGLADAGLKIILCGKMPERTPFLRDKDQDAQVREKVQQLLTRTKNVCCVENERKLPAALQRLGVTPALRLPEPHDLMSVCRTDGNTDYYYIYHRDGAAAVSVELEGCGTVYEMNPWDGSIVMLHTEECAGRVQVTLNMQPGQARIIALEHGAVKQEEKTSEHASMELCGPWELSVERWERDDAGNDTTATKKTWIHVGTTELKPWSEIPGLGWETSGIGTYRTTVYLERNCPMARLSFTDICCQSVHLYVNGHRVPVNHHDMSARIAGLLKAGENVIEVKLVTTLGNQLIAYGMFPTTPWMPEPEKPVKFGLCGPVTLSF